MSDLPRGWTWCTLEELLAPVPRAMTDGPFGSNLKSAHYTDSGARVIRLQNIGDGTFNDERAYISLDHFDTLRNHEVLPGDLVIASLGEELPRACVVPDLGQPAIVKADCIRVRLHSQINVKWVMYALCSPQTRRRAKEKIRGVGRPRLGLNVIRQLPIPLPPLAEQNRIVATLEDHLSRLDAAAHAVTASIARIERLWLAILTTLASGTLLGTKTRIGMRRVAEVADVQGGIQKQPRRLPVDRKYPFLRVANVLRGELNLVEVHEIELFGSELERLRLRYGDLLVVEGNGSADQIGRAAMWHDEIMDCVHQNHLIRVRPGPELDPDYLQFVWNSPQIAQQLRSSASSTSGLYTLSTAKIKAIQLPVPPREVQKRLVDEVERWQTNVRMAANLTRAAKLRVPLLRRSLLAEALQGTLVTQGLGDEPADQLLERIRRDSTDSRPVRVTTSGRGRKARREAALTQSNAPAADVAIQEGTLW